MPSSKDLDQRPRRRGELLIRSVSRLHRDQRYSGQRYSYAPQRTACRTCEATFNIHITHLSNATELQGCSPIVRPSAPVKTPRQTGRCRTWASGSPRLTRNLSAATSAEARFSAFSASCSSSWSRVGRVKSPHRA